MSELNNGDVTDVLDSFFIDYAIDDDDDEATVKELLQQRSDMNKAVNEWYAKAKAFDAILKAYDEAFSREHMAGEVSNIIEKYESGDYDAKK